MSQQTALFYEDFYDVLRAMVQAAGGTKAVASRIWPHKPIAEAQRELLDALNRDRPRKLDPEEVIAILKMAREVGFHAGKHWLDGEVGYQPTQPTDPLIERDRLAEAIIEGAKTLERAIKAAERLPALRSVA